MSVKREKACYDPLSDMLSTTSPEPEEETSIPMPRKPHTHNLKNTLTGDEDFMKFEPKVQTRKQERAPKRNPASTASPDSTSGSTAATTAVAESAPSPKPIEPKKPTGPTSVFESEDDIFLKKDDIRMSASAQISLEEELFGPSAAPMGTVSSMASASSQKGSRGRFGAYEDELDEKFDDLGVADIMEREELDFDLFGKSNVRQMEGHVATSQPAPKVYQEDLRLQSEDDLAAMEAVLNSPTPAAAASRSPEAAAEQSQKQLAFDASNLDINAYIMQQESDSSVSLFD
ncbi:unnamed protein product [Symbiodinium microadriaticum]|nr:unnamed protein product [Symbiodinium microadriaticum]